MFAQMTGADLHSHLRSSSDFPGGSVVKDLPAKQETCV